MDTKFFKRGRSCFALKGLGCTLGLETGAPSRLTPLQATRARTPEGGEWTQPLLQGRGGSDEAYQHV